MEATLVVCPAELLKTKLINDKFVPVPKYKGLISGITIIVKDAGISGLYKGLKPTIIK